MGWDPFRPRGTAARDKQIRQQRNVAKTAIGVIDALKPRMESGVQFGNQLEPFRQSSIMRAIMSLNPYGASQAEIDRIRRTQHDQAAVEAKDLAMQLAESGYGSGAIAGVKREAFQRGDVRANDLITELTQGAGLERRLKLIMALLESGQEIPGLKEFGGLAGLVMGQTPVPVGPGFLESAAPLIASALLPGAGPAAAAVKMTPAAEAAMNFARYTPWASLGVG